MHIKKWTVPPPGGWHLLPRRGGTKKAIKAARNFSRPLSLRWTLSELRLVDIAVFSSVHVFAAGNIVSCCEK